MGVTVVERMWLISSDNSIFHISLQKAFLTSKGELRATQLHANAQGLHFDLNPFLKRPHSLF